MFISELCPARLQQPLVFLTELLAAIPSIVYGLWGIFVLVPAVRGAPGGARPTSLRSVPLFSGPPLGVGMLVGGADPRRDGDSVHLVGGARSAEGGAASRSVRRAYALGATRFEAIRAALFYARTGIIGAIMLGFGRALGETMAVTMVIGNNPQDLAVAVRAAVHDGGRHRQRIHAKRPTTLYLHALIEIGLVLFIITLDRQRRCRGCLIWSMAPRRAPGRQSARSQPRGGGAA